MARGNQKINAREKAEKKNKGVRTPLVSGGWNALLTTGSRN